MKHSLLLSIGLFLSSLVWGQTYSSEISDERVIEFIEWEIDHSEKYNEEPRFSWRRKIDIHIIGWNSDLILFNSDKLFPNDTLDKLALEGLNQLFNPEDLVFLNKQRQSLKDTTWQHRFRGSRLTDKPLQGKSNRYFYSIPIFTANGNYALLQKHYICGNLCGHGAIFVYRKTENGWQLIRTIDAWVS